MIFHILLVMRMKSETIGTGQALDKRLTGRSDYISLL